MVEFVSYDGKYPCLCMGTLTMKGDGKAYRFNHAMISGGSVLCNEEWDMWAVQDDWKINLDEHPELEPYKDEITRVVNDNVEQGCCGGCI